MIKIDPEALYSPEDMRELFGEHRWQRLCFRLKLRRLPGGLYLGAILLDDFKAACIAEALEVHERENTTVSLLPSRRGMGKQIQAQLLREGRL